MSLNPSLAPWGGKRVWIIGASSGIGHAVAEALLARGAQVTVSARREDALQALAARWPQRARVIAVDVADDSLARGAQQLLAAGPLDLVVYCAGHYRPMRASEFDLADALRHSDINYGGALRLLDAVLPALRAQRSGHFSLMASVAGFRGLPLALAYGPTKAALINLAEILYMDLRDDGIGVSIVNPGFVDTPMTADNRFHMPALLTTAQAADAIVRGWERGAFEIHFPLRFTLGLKLLGLLPFRIYQALVRRGTRT